MKKKQLAKLKKQFRPSFEGARKQLFDKMIEKAEAVYQLHIRVFIDPKQPNDMMIELLDPTDRDQQIKVPLDDNFKTVVKRIQNEEKDLLDRFSENLVEEIASYWSPDAARKQVAATPEPKKTEVKKAESKAEPKVEKTTSNDSALTTFSEQISAFPKFAVNETTDQIEVVEQTAKETRLLATISKTEENSFTIETALERKYKLKLDVIPVIEAFAKTPLSER